jgi:hypothetical protein
LHAEKAVPLDIRNNPAIPRPSNRSRDTAPGMCVDVRVECIMHFSCNLFHASEDYTLANALLNLRSSSPYQVSREDLRDHPEWRIYDRKEVDYAEETVS